MNRGSLTASQPSDAARSLSLPNIESRTKLKGCLLFGSSIDNIETV
jgi:hypothetical protein